MRYGRALVERFIAWKSKLPTTPNLKIDHYTGRFMKPEIYREFAAYRQGIRDVLPEQPPQHVLDAMITAGAKPAWVEDIYNAARAALTEDRQT